MPELKRIIPIIILSIILFPSPAHGRDGSGLVQTWDTPQEPEQETADPQPTAEPEQPEGPFLTVGNMWADTGDPGYCLGFAPYESDSYPPTLSWPVLGGVLHDGRGYRIGHPALDIDAPTGRAVKAAAPGVVVWAGESTFFGSGGLVVALSHGGGWITVYSHLSAVLVECLRGVGRGDIIGRVGMSGASNFPHVHFELRQGNLSYNPMLWLGAGA